MQKPDKASIRYSIALIILGLYQLYLIYGLFRSPDFFNTVTSLNVDGEDFAPIFNLFVSGANFIFYKINVFFYILFNAVLSLVVMKILRKYSVCLFTPMTKKFDGFVTIAAGIVCICAGCCFCRFTLIIDAILLSIPVPVVSWLSFHFGRKKNAETASEAS